MNNCEFVYCEDCIKLSDGLHENPFGPSICEKCRKHLEEMANESPIKLMPLKSFEKHNFYIDEFRKLSRRIDKLENKIKHLVKILRNQLPPIEINVPEMPE